MKRKIACLLYNTVSFSSNYASVMKDAIVRKWIVSSTSLCHWLRTVSFLKTALLLLLVQKYALHLARNSNVLNYWQCMHLHHYILPYEIPILFINEKNVIICHLYRVLSISTVSIRKKIVWNIWKKCLNISASRTNKRHLFLKNNGENPLFCS